MEGEAFSLVRKGNSEETVEEQRNVKVPLGEGEWELTR